MVNSSHIYDISLYNTLNLNFELESKVENPHIKIYLVVPFYNEERCLPKFFKKLRCNDFDLKKVGLIGVNHNSTDKSEKIFRNQGVRFKPISKLLPT